MAGEINERISELVNFPLLAVHSIITSFRLILFSSSFHRFFIVRSRAQWPLPASPMPPLKEKEKEEEVAPLTERGQGPE